MKVRVMIALVVGWTCVVCGVPLPERLAPKTVEAGKTYPLVVLFHGDADGAVPASRSRDMFGAIRSYGGLVRDREYPGVGPHCWTRTYGDDEVLAWFFSQRKAN